MVAVSIGNNNVVPCTWPDCCNPINGVLNAAQQFPTQCWVRAAIQSAAQGRLFHLREPFSTEPHSCRATRSLTIILLITTRQAASTGRRVYMVQERGADYNYISFTEHCSILRNKSLLPSRHSLREEIFALHAGICSGARLMSWTWPKLRIKPVAFWLGAGKGAALRNSLIRARACTKLCQRASAICYARGGSLLLLWAECLTPIYERALLITPWARARAL